MDLASLKDWFFTHDWQMFLVMVYIIMNVGPRPHPENLTGYKRIFWLVIDRLAVLSAEKVPGEWKMIFAPSPLPGLPATAPAAPAAPPIEARTEEEPPAVAVPPEDPPKPAA